MEKNKITIIEKGLFSLIFILIFVGQVSAFAISSTYYEGNPLNLYPGESKEFVLTLQNMVGEGDVSAQVNILKGLEIIQLKDLSGIYSVPFGTKTKANFIATIPADAQPGQVYEVEVEFKTIASQESGEFKVGSGISQKFKVVVVSQLPVVQEEIKTEKLEINWTLWVVVILVLILAVLLIIYSFKKRK